MTDTYRVFTKEYKSNGKPFPYQHDEVTYYWLSPIGLWVKEDMTRAQVYTERKEAARDAKVYRGEVRRFRQGETS